MKITKDNKNFLIYLSKYLGVALIAGSVVHIGTLNNGFVRYVVLMIIGLILMIIGNILEAKINQEKINLKYLLLITFLAFGTGFLSGGIQHYLDNPGYAGTLLGIGLFVAYITFFIKEKISLQNKNVILIAIISIALILISIFLTDNLLLGIGHTH